jgi:hypothetical protein
MIITCRTAIIWRNLVIVLFAMLHGMQIYGQDTTGWDLEKMPVALESDFALSALPPLLRIEATVYLLDPRVGYYVSHQGTNGYICFISRTEWEWAEFRKDLAIPMSFDAEGSRSIFPVYSDVAQMRASGKRTATQIKDSVIARILTGVYKAPSKPGMSYMLAPIMRAYKASPDNNLVNTVMGPHYMLYAPYLSDSNTRYQANTEGLMLANPGNMLLGKGKGPFGYIIIGTSDSEKTVIEEQEKDLVNRLGAYKDYFKTEPAGMHHHSN